MGTPSQTWTQSYSYDTLNRLGGVSETGGSGWSQGVTYDVYGNRWVSASTNLAPQPLTPVTSSWYNTTNNRLKSVSYDNAGNQLTLGGLSMTYDAESRMSQAVKSVVGQSWTTQYKYDGDGRRVRKLDTAGANTVYVYDAQGGLAAEYYSGAVMTTKGVDYLTADHLGSTRMIANESGTITAKRDYQPFGEEVPAGTGGRPEVYGNQTQIKQQFTGKERDGETGLDYFGARYLSGAQGRFTSPDEPLFDQSPNDPQSWNLYSCVRNNPLRYTDPTGNKCVNLDGGGQGDDGQPGDPCPESAGINTTHGVTVGVGRDEANLIMLQGIGNAFTGHSVAQSVSDAAQATGRLTGATDIAQCLTSGITGSGCDKTGATLAAIPFLGRVRAINLPGWTRLTIDWAHIAERHMPGGAFTEGRDVFLNLTKDGALAAIEQAYGTATTVSVQGERVLLEGVTKNGMTVQMWLNKVTNKIETAYPVGKQW